MAGANDIRQSVDRPFLVVLLFLAHPPRGEYRNFVKRGNSIVSKLREPKRRDEILILSA